MANEMVEKLARMNLEQRDEFIKTLVKKWPHMAESIGNGIGLELMIKFNQEEANDLGIILYGYWCSLFLSLSKPG